MDMGQKASGTWSMDVENLQYAMGDLLDGAYGVGYRDALNRLTGILDRSNALGIEPMAALIGALMVMAGDLDSGLVGVPSEVVGKAPWALGVVDPRDVADENYSVGRGGQCDATH